MNLEHILGVPRSARRAAGLSANVVLRQDAAGRQQKREPRADPFFCGDKFRQHELALAAHETVDMHNGCPGGRRIVARPLDRSEFVQPRIGHALESRRRRGDLIHNFARMGVAHGHADRVGERHRHLPIGHSGKRRNRLAHAIDAALGVGECAVLFQKRGAGQEHMRVTRGLVEEEILDDDAFHRAQARGDVLRVRIGLRDILALNVEPLERAVDCLVDHIGNAQARLVAKRHAPQAFERLAHGVRGHVAVAGKLMRE